MVAFPSVLVGAVAALSLVAAVFFLRFWSRTGDRFFQLFALAFAIDGVSRLVVAAVHLPAGMPHYAVVDVETIVQINGVGPFDVTYVDPKDDPRKR